MAYAPGAPAAGGPRTVRLHCGRLLTMTSREMDGPQFVDIVDGRVARVGPIGEIGDSPATQSVDLSDLTVLPGLIDAHTHLSLDVLQGDEAAQAREAPSLIALKAASRGRTNLDRGVTTLRLVGEVNFIDVDVRRMFDDRVFPGPRLFTATRGIKGPGGHGVTAHVADGPAEVRRIAEENFARGADHLKLFITGGVATAGTDPRTPFMTREQIAAAVEVARSHGAVVSAHAYGGTAVDDGVAVGLAAIEHGVFITEPQYARMASAGCALVATLGVYLTEPGPAENPAWPAEVREKFKRARELAPAAVALAKRSGVRIALGTDAIHGGMLEEIVFAASAGLTNRDAIGAATVEPARLLGRTGELGVIAPGSAADLFAVRGNPLRDITALRSISWVMRAGEVVANSRRAPVAAAHGR
ncbi:MAG: hypothetical protein QOH08_1057 [Chloroflexota bacterium]|jgi:imidazolonepropionase-like amidohydrolase|nr:hypothetical protein [Chloroflexota bacterium]